LDSASINICIVSYRDKRIVETINNAYNKAALKDRIKFFVTIQDSYHYKVKKTEKDLINYLPWDNFEGFATQRFTITSYIPAEEYILFVSSATEFTDQWDIKILNNLKSNKIKSIKNSFSVDGTFIKKQDLDIFGYPHYLRLMGEEEDLSIRAFCNGYDFEDSLLEIINILDKKEHDYIPFSKTHNYDQVQSLYDTGSNKFINLIGLQRNFKEYALINPIKKNYHQLNDVEYLRHQIGELQRDRFYTHGSRI
jgi:hypothetical protein